MLGKETGQLPSVGPEERRALEPIRDGWHRKVRAFLQVLSLGVCVWCVSV